MSRHDPNLTGAFRSISIICGYCGDTADAVLSHLRVRINKDTRATLLGHTSSHLIRVLSYVLEPREKYRSPQLMLGPLYPSVIVTFFSVAASMGTGVR